MDKYFYFAAQLPQIGLDQKENIPTRDFFIEEASKWLSKSDLTVLLGIDINGVVVDSQNKTLKQFQNFEYEIKSEIAKYRKSTKEDFEYKTNLFPMSLIKDGNPLEVELNLLKYRWDYLDENQLGHYSDLTFLIVYYLKLQILWRISSFDKEKFKEIFKEACDYESSAA